MVGEPLTTRPEEHDHDLLRMPDYRQAQNASECIYYALWTAIHYVANSYPDKNIRNEIKPPKLDLIAEYIETGTLGWETPSQEPLSFIATEIGGLKLNLQYQYNGFPQTVDKFVQERYDQLLPTIIWIDRLLLEKGERGTGPMHAVVVCGVGDTHVTIEDPLVEGPKAVKIGKLEEAWDPEYNTAIEVRLSDSLEPTRREAL